MSEPAGRPSPPEPAAPTHALTYRPLDAFRHEVADAKRLLDFAVAGGRSVDETVFVAVKRMENWLIGETTTLPPDEARTVFEQAYRDLAQVMAPVTASTLRDTSDSEVDGRRVFLLARKPTSEARIWSRKLWGWAIVTSLVILFSENVTRVLAEFFPADLETSGLGFWWQVLNRILQSLEPFAYGALGALAFLLRSAHTYIHERTFDRLRMPEYYNRILLGMISGGAIKLFITEVTTDDGTAIELSGAALAFIAGYNSDFLFTTIERIAAAILPKVGLESVRRAAPDRMALVTIERLVTRYAAADDSEKKMIERLVDRLTQGSRAEHS